MLMRLDVFSVAADVIENAAVEGVKATLRGHSLPSECCVSRTQCPLCPH